MQPWNKRGVTALAVVVCAIQIGIWHQMVLAKESEFDKGVSERLHRVATMMQNDALCVHLNARQYMSAGSEFYLMMPNISGANADTIPEYWYPAGDDRNVIKRSHFPMDLPARVDVSVKMQFMVPGSTTHDAPISEIHQEAVDELRNALSTRMGGNTVKLLDTALLKSTVRSELLIDPVREIEFAIVERNTGDIKYATIDPRTDLGGLPYTVPVLVTTATMGPWDLLVGFPGKRKAFALDLLPTLFLILLGMGALGLWLWLVLRSAQAKKRSADLKLDLVHNITHEFNTPVANISFALETLKGRREQGHNAADLIQVMEQAKDRLSSNISKLFAVTFYEKDDLLLDQELHDVHHLLDGCTAQFALALEQQGCTLEKAYDAIRSWVMVDRTYLINAFSCLIDNSIKHGGAGTKVQVLTRNNGDLLQVEIRDDGPGIPKEERSKVFNKFHRTKVGRSVPGAGIGLYFARKVLQAHQGSIAILDVKNGTWMRITLRGADVG